MIIQDARMIPVRKCKKAKKFKSTEDGYLEPTYYSDPSGVEKSLFQIGDPIIIIMELEILS